MFAQLRDVLAAKDSSVVSQKNEHSPLLSPQGAKTSLLAVAIGKSKFCEFAAEGIAHDSSIFSRRDEAVKQATPPSALSLPLPIPKAGVASVAAPSSGCHNSGLRHRPGVPGKFLVSFLSGEDSNRCRF